MKLNAFLFVITMHCLAIQTSPNIDGLTASLAEAVITGVNIAGGSSELVHLNQLNIQSCIACDNGWGQCRTKGICILEDDFEDLRPKIQRADVLCFVSPVYFHDISESAKRFLDRLRRCEFFSDTSRFDGKNVIGVTAAGGSGRGTARALYLLEDYLRRLQFEIVDLIDVTRSSKKRKIAMLTELGTQLG